MSSAKNFKVSVVVLTCNSAGTLELLLESLRRQTLPPHEIVVVDCGSTDGTIEIARKYGCIVYDKPVKVRAEARNIGVKISKGDIIAFIDSDCVAERNWLEELVKNFDDIMIAGVSGKVSALNSNKLIPKLIDLATKDEPHYATWNIAYRKCVLDEVNGFDSKLHACEDQALAWKIIRKGYRMVWNPNAIVYHKHRESLFSFLKQQYDYGTWAIIAKKMHGIGYHKSLLLLFAIPLLFIFKYIRKITIHPLLPFFLALSALAYSLGAWRGFAWSLRSEY
ncbi:MAG: glycosyltransferase [Thermofilum sp.]|nr:glycosyltransferase [Thermofilum sp.]